MATFEIKFGKNDIVTIFHVNTEKEALEIYEQIYKDDFRKRPFKVYKTTKVSRDQQ